MAEASPAFKQQIREAFDAIQPGQSFSFRRTFTEADAALFIGVTGDYNPYHIDEIFAGESWYGRRTLPGLLTASMITHMGGMIGFLATDMHFDFLAGVCPGDTITCTITFTDKDATKRRLTGSASYVNQDGKEVLRATFHGFPSLVRLAR